MTGTRQFRAIKGVRDILPPDTSLWNRVEQTARDVFVTYGYGEIRLPIFEETELFARSIGVGTDVVNKEMYSFNELAVLRVTVLLSEPSSDDLASVERYLEQLEAFSQELGEFGREAAFAGQDEAGFVWTLTRQLGGLIQYMRVDERLAQTAEDRVNSRAQRGTQLSVIVKDVRSLLERLKLPDNLALRPEATASVCRAYIEHGMHTWPHPVKLYYMGPMFRRERPQKGRYRQFYQIGAEVLTSSREEKPEADARIDAEVIEMLLAFFRRVGLEGTELYVNSIGCKECRPKYVELLREELRKVKDKLGADSQRRIDTNPLRVLDSKMPDEQAIIEKLPRISDHLCSACRENFAQLQEELKLRRISYEINWRLVRGLDYYTRTTFEITAAGLGSQNAVCGGGRYDGLVKLLGGPSTKGIGFAIGTDRVILSLQEASKEEAKKELDVFIAWMGGTAYGPAVRLARELRDVGLSVELPPEEMKFKKSLGLADKLGARYALIIGEDEVASGQFTLKSLADGEQRKLSESMVVEYLESGRRGSDA